MKRNILILTGLLVLTLSFGVYALPANQHKYSGKIVMIDPKLDLMIVKGKEGEKAFHSDRKTMITIGGQRKLFSELQKGEQVNVTYKDVNNSRVASQITLGSAQHS
jgi:hypothetical protein